jgi:L-fuculokinase
MPDERAPMLPNSPTRDTPCIAVVDIGKSNAKLLIVDTVSTEVIWSATRPCKALATTPIQQLDIDGIEQWLLESLSSAPHRDRIEAIVPIAHGAAAVLLDASGKPLFAPDYEDPEFNSIAVEYRVHRDAFATTFSPELGDGLNLGRQLYYLQKHMPELYERCHHIVPYAQYWAFRLCGVLASEVTSLGCHTDVWNVRDAEYSLLAWEMDWTQLFPPILPAAESLGKLKAEISRLTGVNPRCRVLCGLHDSNASYYSHLIGRSNQAPFTVISSGTWTVAMSRGIELDRLQPHLDMLANVDVFGTPVGTARFMGGREFADIADNQDGCRSPSIDHLRTVIDHRTLAIPSFAPSGGPFAGNRGRIVNCKRMQVEERMALASIYIALMTDYLLDLLDARGDVVVDGPLSTNRLYTELLAAFRLRNPLQVVASRAGPVIAALHLAGFNPKISPANAVARLELPGLSQYRAQWRATLPNKFL